MLCMFHPSYLLPYIFQFPLDPSHSVGRTLPGPTYAKQVYLVAQICYATYMQKP